MTTRICTWWRYRRLLRTKLNEAQAGGYRLSAASYARLSAEARREALCGEDGTAARRFIAGLLISTAAGALVWLAAHYLAQHIGMGA